MLMATDAVPDLYMNRFTKMTLLILRGNGLPGKTRFLAS